MQISSTPFILMGSRNRAARLLAALLVAGSAAQLHAQVAPSALESVRQSNAQLSEGVLNGGRPTPATRAAVIARHEQLQQVFRETPEKARSYALNAETRLALWKAEPSYAALIEQDVPLTGELISSEADDFANHTSTKHYTLHTWTGDRGLSFATAQPNIERLVHHKITVTGLSLPEIIAAESMREASPAEAQAEKTVRVSSAFSTAVSANTLAASAVTANATPLAFTGPGVPSGSATTLNSTFGNQTVAVLILNFAGGTISLPSAFAQQSFWDQDWNGPATPNVNEYTKEVSYNQTSVAADVYGPITVPGNYDCKTTDTMGPAAVTAAIAAGLDVSKYNHFVLVYPVKSCYFGGLGTTGPASATALIPHQYTYIWIPINVNLTATPDNVDFLWFAGSQHEFGHNLGMNHSNSLDFGALSLGPLDYVSANPGTVTPGGHAPEAASAPESAFVQSVASFSAAAAVTPSGSTSIVGINTEYGDNFAGMGDPQGPYNGQHRTSILGWIPASGTQDVTSSGSFTISPSELSTGLRTLHVLRDPISSSWVWVEFHQPVGIYTPRSESHDPLDLNPNTLYNGAQLHYQDGFNNDGHTLLMDMTPIRVPNNFYDNNLAPGSSWSDPFSPLTITAGTQGTNSLGVSVSYDSPCATVALNAPTIPVAGGSGSVTLTAPASCAWSVSSNANWISFPGATTGTGNGTVTFTATPNTAALQRNSYITAQRQSLPLIQDGTAISIVGLSPAVNTTAPGSSVPLTVNLSDARGIADLSQLNVTVAGGTNPDCSIVATSAGTKDSIWLFLPTNGSYGSAVLTGTPGTLTNGSCTIDTVNSSYADKGKIGTLKLALSFPSTFQGIHSVTASASDANNASSATLPVGFVNVTTTVAAQSSVAVSPASAGAPLSGTQGATVPFTIVGANTAFTPSSTIQMGGSGVTVSSLSFVSPTKLTGSLTIGAKAAKGARSMTVTSGNEIDATTFTVVTAAAPTVSLSPASALKGSKTSVTITGIDTTFLPTSTIKVSGDRVQANKVTYVNPTTMTAEFVVAADAASNSRVVTITSGSEVDTAAFVVIPDVQPSLSAMPNTGNEGNAVSVVFTGTNTAFTTGTTVDIPGTDINIKRIAVLGPSSIQVDFVIADTAMASVRVVKITTGTQVVKTNFTVTAFAPTVTSIVSQDATITTAQSTVLTATITAATGTPVGFVSFKEDKGAVGLEGILGTVQLSGGSASLPISNLPAGVHTFVAQYLGDNANFAASDSTVKAKVMVTQAVQPTSSIKTMSSLKKAE